ncbi:hypothetical protein A3E39_03975 [Candidatus Uhrbacteria bacterium RIFCSPHIGHO2_12_FULL_60_25]|uniref:Uncharacterized protein n=1 Tax=Candidatus Uhrbacteria bacterium RIFCSPHIGHO2_12_FULL_60_25 TaxID=1802399 RepID=A0A1F7UP05_9BACT|nr:MAG: hypothetical protein A3D73_03910 [Candidatus Uhrbacteria bacterium RIFCSPHIGHO2_02_FULL_60_44]OGL79438.1 MAG: hypothetical protein A3E39_03975 [Candidatus Uhrbacteria bacterium RIFCSPHIGHO2_12_FULL_60_25]
MGSSWRCVQTYDQSEQKPSCAGKTGLSGKLDFLRIVSWSYHGGRLISFAGTRVSALHSGQWGTPRVGPLASLAATGVRWSW